MHRFGMWRNNKMREKERRGTVWTNGRNAQLPAEIDTPTGTRGFAEENIGRMDRRANRSRGRYLFHRARKANDPTKTRGHSSGCGTLARFENLSRNEEWRCLRCRGITRLSMYKSQPIYSIQSCARLTTLGQEVPVVNFHARISPPFFSLSLSLSLSLRLFCPSPLGYDYTGYEFGRRNSSNTLKQMKVAILACHFFQ